MGKIINFFNKQKQDEYEVCIVCKKKTTVKREKPITQRYTYIEGVGHLCSRCYKELLEQNAFE